MDEFVAYGGWLNQPLTAQFAVQSGNSGEITQLTCLLLFTIFTL